MGVTGNAIVVLLSQTVMVAVIALVLLFLGATTGPLSLLFLTIPLSGGGVVSTLRTTIYKVLISLGYNVMLIYVLLVGRAFGEGHAVSSSPPGVELFFGSPEDEAHICLTHYYFFHFAVRNHFSCSEGSSRGILMSPERFLRV